MSGEVYYVNTYGDFAIIVAGSSEQTRALHIYFNVCYTTSVSNIDRAFGFQKAAAWIILRVGISTVFYCFLLPRHEPICCQESDSHLRGP